MPDLDERRIYITAALDQLRVAIRDKNTSAAEIILTRVYERYPDAAELILDRLIAAGLRHQDERR